MTVSLDTPEVKVNTGLTIGKTVCQQGDIFQIYFLYMTQD